MVSKNVGEVAVSQLLHAVVQQAFTKAKFERFAFQTLSFESLFERRNERRYNRIMSIFYRRQRRQRREAGETNWGQLGKVAAVVVGAVVMAKAAGSGNGSTGSPAVRMEASSKGGIPLGKVIIGSALAVPVLKWFNSLPDGSQPETVPQPTLTPGSEIPDWRKSFASLASDTKTELEAPVKPASALWVPELDAQWLQIIHHPAVVLIIGKRDAGKSALGNRLLELLRSQGAPYVVGLPIEAQKLLPDWIGTAEHLEDVPTGAVVLLDESYLQLHARGSMTEAGRAIGNLINLSRQKRQTLIFIVQEARQLDVNIVSQVDVLAMKELSDLSQGFERPQFRKFTDKARAAFATVQGDKRKCTWVYSEAANFEGMVKNELATFWNSRLSHAYGQSASGELAPPRRGHRLSREDQKDQARRMHASNPPLSYPNIARNLGISTGTAWNLVNED